MTCLLEVWHGVPVSGGCAGYLEPVGAQGGFLTEGVAFQPGLEAPKKKKKEYHRVSVNTF